MITENQKPLSAPPAFARERHDPSAVRSRESATLDRLQERWRGRIGHVRARTGKAADMKRWKIIVSGVAGHTRHRQWRADIRPDRPERDRPKWRVDPGEVIRGDQAHIWQFKDQPSQGLVTAATVSRRRRTAFAVCLMNIRDVINGSTLPCLPAKPGPKVVPVADRARQSGVARTPRSEWRGCDRSLSFVNTPQASNGHGYFDVHNSAFCYAAAAALRSWVCDGLPCSD